MAPDPAPALLIVSDIEEESRLLASTLNALYQVQTVTNNGALDWLYCHPPPELILAGNLTDREGLDFWRQLHADPVVREIPLLVITSPGECPPEQVGLHPGGADWLNRPLVPTMVRLRAANLLQMKRMRDALHIQSGEMDNRAASLVEANRRLRNEIDERRRVEHDLRSALEDLAIAKDQAEEADRLKSVFLAAVSHELRTPMNSIIGFTGILSQGLAGPLNDEQKKQLGIVRRSAEHLLALVNDVLDLSKIAAGQLAISFAPFDPHALLESVLKAARPLADRKGLVLGMTLAPDAGLMVSDRRRVEQIIANLVNNAIKFTHHGSVTIEGHVHAGWMIIRVKDTGIGIKGEDIPQLFRAFQQVETGLARRYEGTGLGLAICAKLASLLGGTISVDSVWGKGSTFTVTLPAAIPENSPMHS